MIWHSVPLMTAIDLLVTGGSIFSVWYFWARRARLRQAKSQFGALLVLIGLSVFGAFFFADLFVMHAVPWI